MSIETHEITYTAGDTQAHGVLAVPAGQAKVPGIAIFADIMGLGKQTKAWGARIAEELGYLTLAADVYRYLNFNQLDQYTEKADGVIFQTAV